MTTRRSAPRSSRRSSRGQSIDRDIIVMTDNSKWPSLLVEKGWVEKLDKSAIPNIKNLEPALQHPAWDPHRDYSLPWQSGMVGIAFNDTLTDPVLSIDDLLGNAKLKGKITVLNEMADCISPSSCSRTETTLRTSPMRPSTAL